MTVFDLLFLALVFAIVVTLVLAGLAAIRGRGARARASLRRLGAGVGVYLGILVLVSVVSPRRILNVGDDQCWDDWCIAVTNVLRRDTDDGRSYEVTFRVASRARRRAQCERGVIVRLMDDLGRCYDPVPAPAALSFDVLLEPHQAVYISRMFNVPADAHDPAVVVSHEGWFPGLFIIGDAGSLFHKRTSMRLE